MIVQTVTARWSTKETKTLVKIWGIGGSAHTQQDSRPEQDKKNTPSCLLSTLTMMPNTFTACHTLVCFLLDLSRSCSIKQLYKKCYDLRFHYAATACQCFQYRCTQSGSMHFDQVINLLINIDSLCIESTCRYAVLYRRTRTIT